MDKSKIAILDSGCNILQIEKYNVARLKNFVSSDELCLDDNGHGTAIFEILSRLQPEAEYTIIKVLDEKAESRISVIIQALEYLLTLSIDYVCMSFSTKLDYANKEMYALCQQLQKQGKVLVASKANSGETSYPAEIDNVIGVEGIVCDSPHQIFYMPGRSIQVIADVLPIMVPTKDGMQYVMFGGNSKAAAQVCGELAGASCELEKFLQINRCSKIWTDEEIQKKKIYTVKNYAKQHYTDELFKHICNALEGYEKGLSEKENLHPFFSASDYYNILLQIEKEADILINYIDMQYKDFDTAESLYEKLHSLKTQL